MRDMILRDKLVSVGSELKPAKAMLHIARWQHFSLVSDLAKASKRRQESSKPITVSESVGVEDTGYKVRRDNSQLTIATPEYLTASCLGTPLKVGSMNAMQALVREGRIIRVQGLS